MPNYRRFRRPGGTYFFTIVTYKRTRILCDVAARDALRRAIRKTQWRYPFESVAWVLLPDHLHCIWELPEGDSDFSTRGRLIKTRVTLYADLRLPQPLWQPRFWEHCVRDQEDLNRHIDYIHYNPVKHGLVDEISSWPFSTYGSYVEMGFYGGESQLSGVEDLPGAEWD